jgi:hypothetical protein
MPLQRLVFVPGIKNGLRCVCGCTWLRTQTICKSNANHLQIKRKPFRNHRWLFVLGRVQIKCKSNANHCASQSCPERKPSIGARGEGREARGPEASFPRSPTVPVGTPAPTLCVKSDSSSSALWAGFLTGPSARPQGLPVWQRHGLETHDTTGG